ncbi:MAG: hypothetical protein IBJ11_07945 [Phycisphaerales bacterium]|nr:hypothetical protein [Phycisphaerales bacterium]
MMVRRRSLGITIVEVLAVAGIIAALLALLMPAIASARARAEFAVGLSRARQHVQVMGMYAVDFRGVYPMLARPDQPWTLIGAPDNPLWVRFFDVGYLWRVGLAARYYDVRPSDPVFHMPGADPRRGFLYSYTLFTDWRFWTWDMRGGTEQWRSVRLDEVRYPSNKGVFISVYPWYDRPELPPRACVAFADGSADLPEPSEFLEYYPSSSPEFPWAGWNWAGPVLTTINGFRGRDR